MEDVKVKTRTGALCMPLVYQLLVPFNDIICLLSDPHCGFHHIVIHNHGIPRLSENKRRHVNCGRQEQGGEIDCEDEYHIPKGTLLP